MEPEKERPPVSDQTRSALEKALELEQGYDFEQAKAIYEDILAHTEDEQYRADVQWFLEDIDDLIAEKRIYTRIHQNAIRTLTGIGMNITENDALMEILMAADAIDFEKETATFIPLREEYVERCLARVPRELPYDPGRSAFGTGATPPFLKRTADDELRPANRDEYGRIVQVAEENQDVVGIFSFPVATDNSISPYDAAQVMEQGFSGLKMAPTHRMADHEAAFLKGKEEWVDGTSLITALTPMGTMVDPFLRSVQIGNNLLLLDLTIAGMSGCGSPESLLTQIHAQVLFMMVLAQTVNPGICCMHGGIPGVSGPGGDLSYSSRYQPIINVAMAGEAGSTHP
jgi:trimethylamine--corrinoid protein Co-methyltransferase